MTEPSVADESASRSIAWRSRAHRAETTLNAVRVALTTPGASDAEIVGGLRAYLRLVDQPGTFEHKGVVGTFFHGGCQQPHFPGDPCPPPLVQS